MRLDHHSFLTLGALSLCVLALGACSSGSGSSGSGSGSSGGEVNFSVGSVLVPEVGVVLATVILSEARSEDTDVNFVTLSPPFPTPVATFNGDYQVLTTSPLRIPAGSVSANITMIILADGDGELDEGFVVRLVSATDTDIGSSRDFFATIQDDDEVRFDEAEPNDPEALADVVGAIDPGLAYQINGIIDASAVDFFRLSAGAATDVWIELTPLTTGPDVVLTIRDFAGTTDLAGPIDENGPGESEGLVYPAAAGETFLIEVFNTFTGGMYRLDVVGLAPVNPLVPAGATERLGAWIIDTDSGAVVRIEETVDGAR